jgi:hypothetical protein
VHFKFLPGLGFYGFGLVHMLGGLSRTATAALRQLIDAGTLSNLPAGFKARGLRIRDDDSPLQPGEFRDVDAPSGDLRAGLLPLPYKEPSQTLYALLGFVVQTATRFATVADQKIGENLGSNAPVGTTMALMERGTKVMSAIHKRLHYGRMYTALGVTDIQAILPLPPRPAPMDPGMENAGSLKGMQLKAFPQQNHDAHINAHRGFMSSVLVKNNPVVMSILQSHIAEHTSLQAREVVQEKFMQPMQELQQQIQMAQSPEQQQELQQQIQAMQMQMENDIAGLINEMTTQMIAEEQEAMQDTQEDPLIRLKEQELQLRAMEMQRKDDETDKKLNVERERIAATDKIAQDRIDSQEDIAQLRANVNLSKQKQ